MKTIEAKISKLYEGLKKGYENEIHRISSGDLDQCITHLCEVRLQYFSGLKDYSPAQREFYGRQIEVLEHLYGDVREIYRLETQKKLDEFFVRDMDRLENRYKKE